MEEKFRSHILRQQIKAFEEKVYQSDDQFSVDVLYRMFGFLTKRTVVDVRKVKSFAILRNCLKEHKKTLRCKLRYRNVQATPEDEKIVKYFTWFWKFIDYLKELRNNFVERIYNPLFRYFYSIGYNQPDREDSTASTPSVLSYRSGESGYSGFSGLTSVLAEGNAEYGPDEWDESQAERRRFVTKQALITLSREFRDIKSLYDSSEIEKLAHRLSHLKERLSYLLDFDGKIDSAMLSQDSERAVFHLKIKDQPIENLIRIVPDILIKFQKAAWLAFKWLEKDDQKTKDVNEKLDKLTALEAQMNKRLHCLSNEIQLKERELELQTDNLNKLLEREERTTNLSQTAFDLEKKKTTLTEQFNKLNNERKELSEKLTDAAKTNDKNTYRRLRPLYERNKLQRFALERQLATLSYHMNLADDDMQVELEIKPSVINSTNEVQDRCEELEQRIEKARKEQKVIQAALIPIVEDKRFISEQLELTEELPVSGPKPTTQAEFIGSSATPLRSTSITDRLTDIKTESLNQHARKQSVSLFLTSFPDDDHVKHARQPINTLPAAIRHKPVIEVTASEW